MYVIMSRVVENHLSYDVEHAINPRRTISIEILDYLVIISSLSSLIRIFALITHYVRNSFSISCSI